MVVHGNAVYILSYMGGCSRNVHVHKKVGITFSRDHNSYHLKDTLTSWINPRVNE